MSRLTCYKFRKLIQKIFFDINAVPFLIKISALGIKQITRMLSTVVTVAKEKKRENSEPKAKVKVKEHGTLL